MGCVPTSSPWDGAAQSIEDGAIKRVRRVSIELRGDQRSCAKYLHTRQSKKPTTIVPTKRQEHNATAHYIDKLHVEQRASSINQSISDS